MYYNHLHSGLLTELFYIYLTTISRYQCYYNKNFVAQPDMKYQ